MDEAFKSSVQVSIAKAVDMFRNSPEHQTGGENF
jgi:hypothetical protein